MSAFGLSGARGANAARLSRHTNASLGVATRARVRDIKCMSRSYEKLFKGRIQIYA